MASPYTSIQNGLWDASDVDTWGQGLNVYPQLAGDVVNIGHTVTYNKVSTVEMGAITINSGGILLFSLSMTTKLTLGHADILIKNGGELRCGTAAGVLPKAYTADLIWDTTADNAKGINIETGGKLTQYGDPALYGSVESAILAANWTAGQTFTVVGDLTGKWAVGQIITVHKNPATYGNYNTDVRLFTIASVVLNGSNTDITINEAAPAVTFLAGARVEMISRNVRLSKLGANTAIGNYNSLRPRIYDRNVQANNNCVISNALITGFYGIDSSYNFQLLKSPIRNGYYAFYSGAGHTVSGPVYSNNYAFYFGTGHSISGPVYSNYSGFYSGAGHTVSGPVYGNNVAFYYCIGLSVSGPVYSNYSGFYIGDYIITGKIGFTAGDVAAPNTIDIYLASGAYPVRLINCKIPTAGLVITRNYLGCTSRVACEHYKQICDAHYVLANFGDIQKIAVGASGSPTPPTANPPSGNSNIIDVQNVQSLCSATSYLEILRLRIWALANVSKTYRFYVQSTFVELLTTNFKLYADYLSGSSPPAFTTISSTQAIVTRTGTTDWSQYVEVTVNPIADGWVDLYVRLMKYESGQAVYLDPEVNIS